MSSAEVLKLFDAGEEIAISTDQPQQRSGFETWFTIPGLPAAQMPPPKWKMAIVTWLALLPQVLLLSFVIPPQWPRLAGVALGTAIPVVALTWFVMPRLTVLLKRWLFATARERSEKRPGGLA